MKILVTDGDTRSGLAAVRSLGQAGHEVIVATTQHPSLASASRFAAGHVIVPNPGADPAAFVHAVHAEIARRHIELVMPMTEVTTLLLAEKQDELPSGCRFPFADVATVSRAADKAYVVGLAGQLGVPVPATIVVDSPAQALARAHELPWPIVAKPARSRVREGSRWLSTSVAYAHDAAELAALVNALPLAAFPLLLQERIVGGGAGVFACCDRGRPVALFAHSRLREKPPSGGVSVLCESAPLDERAVAHATRLLEALRWHGVAMVEFKRDDRDGSLRLMEINGRFWGSLQLAIDAGVDFPRILAAVAQGHPPAAPPDYRVGVRSRWLAGDLDALLLLLRKSRAQLNLPPAHPGRWRALRDFLRADPARRYEIERRSDFGPARLEWRRWLGLA
jgi:predicted ATP-grasp superfamily ATP-dependent carboligase